MKLMIKNKEAVIGQKVSTSDGKTGILERVDKPHKPSSTGRVYVRCEDEKWINEWFPNVINAHWIEREDHI